MKLESNWLVSSHAVASVQRFFGLELVEPSSDSAQQHFSTSNGHGSKANAQNGLQHRQQQQPLQPDETKEAANEPPRYCVKNWFWYGLFAFGASLGDDIFYYTFYPFWFYNLSPWVIRRVILMWGMVMYVGQSSKEILRWPRPSEPPAVRIEKRYFKEYGMPSTHAMVGTLVPFTILAVTWDHYEYSHTVGVILASSYTLLVCFSRLYRGMHYILDILVGTAVCFLLMAIYLQFMDALDYFLLTHPYAPIVITTVAVFLCLIFPCKEGWSSTRNDTTLCAAVVSGVMTASWFCNRLGWVIDVKVPYPQPVVWPGWTSIGLMLLRELIGVAVMVVVHVTARAIVLFLLSIVMGKKIDRKKDPNNVYVELPYKYTAYFLIVFSMLVISPMAFKTLGIPIHTFNV